MNQALLPNVVQRPVARARGVRAVRVGLPCDRAVRVLLDVFVLEVGYFCPTPRKGKNKILLMLNGLLSDCFYSALCSCA